MENNICTWDEYLYDLAKVMSWNIRYKKDYVFNNIEHFKFSWEHGIHPLLALDQLKYELGAKKYQVETLTIPDIRNKLSPITNMIALFERGEYAYIKNKGLDEVKKSINYLAQRDVYETI
ncbi:MAG TPA: hypothetical protein VLA48_03545 [Nitrososphaeraceae archaeon]|nr:hypothetical protein [Nitrososphaeraceae archaeon]